MFYDLAKIAVNRLAYSHGHELAPFGATAVAFTPGWLRSEMMLDNFGVTEDELADALGGPATATPPGLRRLGDAALRRPRRRRDGRRRRTARDGTSSPSRPAQLAREYGFTDVDGRQPDGWA